VTTAVADDAPARRRRVRAPCIHFVVRVSAAHANAARDALGALAGVSQIGTSHAVWW
jgi:hypothetical protein